MNNTVYRRHFTALRGVDFSPSADISKSHLADMENMWRDPVAENGSLESYPGYRVFATLPSPVFGIYHQRVGEKSYLVVHAKSSLYRFESALRNHPRELAALSPLPVTVKEEKGCAFASGESLFLLIGKDYLKILPDGTVKSLERDECAYVPLTYHNGEAYEQRNLLTDEVRHTFTADGGEYKGAEGEETLRFRPYSEKEMSCAVYASSKSADIAVLKIPKTAVIDGEIYTVRAIENGAFTNMRSLVSVSLPSTIELVGSDAFAGCTALLSASLPDGARQIGRRAFYGCLSLTELYLPASLESIGENAFAYTTSLREILYGGDEAGYAAIAMLGEDTLRERELTLTVGALPMEDHAAIFRYPLLDPTVEILSVSLPDVRLGEDFIFYQNTALRYRTVKDEELYTHIELITSDESFLAGKTLTLRLLASPSLFSTPRAYTAFGAGHPELSGKSAVCACRIAAAHDGRVFLTGNPSLPATVFHSLPDETGLNNPFYIGNLSYFNDGVGSSPNRALLSLGKHLAVFKEDTDGGGAIYYHKGESTGINLVPRIYPVESALCGVGAVGEAVSFKDDPVFLSGGGLMGIEKQSLSLERSVLPRSFPVSARLCREELSRASLAVHEGMLYLLTDGRIYLADSRFFRSHSDGSVGYEWYFLSGIGAYENDRPLYKRTAHLPDGALAYGILPADDEAVAQGTVYSVTLPSGTLAYYEKTADGKKYAVDTDGERTGGTFSPASVLCAAGGVLFFGTEGGHLGCMNTDKRGRGIYRLFPSHLYAKRGEAYVPLCEGSFPYQSGDAIETLPLYQKEEDAFLAYGDGEVYIDGGSGALAERLDESLGVREVHPYFYTFDGHAYTAACTLAADDGGIPNYAKDTVPLSAAIKVKTASGGSFRVLVRTERTPWHECEMLSAGRADFSDLDFTRLDVYAEESATLPLRERERGWCYKQFRLAETEARRPFGLYALFYAYTPSGHIKT